MNDPKPVTIRRPVLRTSSTLCLPDDPCPVTLETIVIEDATADDDTAADATHLPELAEAGWNCTSVGPLLVYQRLVC